MDKRKLMILTSVVCLLPALSCLIMYGSLPEEIPVHISISGQAGSFAPKWFVAFGMPCFLFLFNIFCHWKVNKTAGELYYPEIAQVFIKWAMPVISAAVTAASMAAVKDITSWIMLLSVVTVLVILFGELVYEGKMEYIGDKDFPWSSSEKAEKRSGIIFMAAGMAALVVSVFGEIVIAVGLIVIGIIISCGAAVRS